MRFLPLVLLLLCLSVPLGDPLALAAGAGTQLIDRQALQQLFDDFLAENSAKLPGVELRFSHLDLPEPYEVPQGRIEQQLIPAKPGVIGSRRITLLTRVDDQVVANLSVRVELEALAEVVVANNNLKRGTLLAPEDVSLQQRDISSLRDPLFSIAEVTGQRLKRTLRLGQPLSQRQIDFPPLIKRGERVEIQAQHAGLLVTAVGESRQDGNRGDSIRVVNSNSRRELLCRVVAPGLVSVEF